MADQQYDNSQRGVLFRNDKKDSEKHPDYKGNGEVNGVEVWISAWIKKSKAGVSYMSLSFENKDGQVVAQTQVAAPAQGDVPIDTSGLGDGATVGADDDIPF